MAAQREWFEKDYYAVLGVPDGRDREGARRAPTGSSRSSTTPTRTRATRTPRSASRRSPPRTTCSATPRSARSTTRSGAWSRRASGPAVRRRLRRSGRLRRRPDVPASTTDGDGGGFSDLLGNLFGGGAAAGAARGRGGRPVRSAATTSRPSCTSTSTTRCTASRRTVRFRADAACSTCATAPAPTPGTLARDVPAVPRHRLDRGRPGPVLVLAGVPDVRRARPGHPDAVPDVPRPRRRGARRAR